MQRKPDPDPSRFIEDNVGGKQEIKKMLENGRDISTESRFLSENKNQGLDPVLVIFFEGLMGPGGFV